MYLVDAVAARLRKEIIDGQFQFGEALSEAKIAKRYDVSRTPVREAFVRLEQEGLLRTEPQIGTFIFTMDEQQFAKLSEVRSVLEAAAFDATCARHRDELIKEWKNVLSTMSKAVAAKDLRRYAEADGEFHDALFRYSENPYLEDAKRSFHAKIAAVRARLSTTPEHILKSFDEHKRLLALLQANEIKAASRLLEHHIRHKGANFWPASQASARPRRERIEALM